MIRTTVRIVLLAAAFFTMMYSNCSFDVGTTRIWFQNNGLDPIHVGGRRVGQGATGEISTIENGMGVIESLKRENIDLGTITITQSNGSPDESYTATITMTEPTYFDFHFSSDNPDVGVSYSRP